MRVTLVSEQYNHYQFVMQIQPFVPFGVNTEVRGSVGYYEGKYPCLCDRPRVVCDNYDST